MTPIADSVTATATATPPLVPPTYTVGGGMDGHGGAADIPPDTIPFWPFHLEEQYVFYHKNGLPEGSPGTNTSGFDPSTAYNDLKKAIAAIPSLPMGNPIPQFQAKDKKDGNSIAWGNGNGANGHQGQAVVLWIQV